MTLTEIQNTLRDKVRESAKQKFGIDLEQVAVEIPPKIGKVLSGDLTKVIDGEEPSGGLELGWICSFSLPIITLCAFIVLHIFLGLLNIVFQWMLWFKICIPIPKKKAGG